MRQNLAESVIMGGHALPTTPPPPAEQPQEEAPAAPAEEPAEEQKPETDSEQK